MIALNVSHITKSFEGQPLLRGVSFEVSRGEIACLLGPSGSGKTTLLRIICGLERPESGKVAFDGQDMSDIPTDRRSFGLMFQDLALFPHRNVFDNVAFGLRMQNLPGKVIAERVHESLELVGLTGFASRDVNQLSGGEQQRVALARALAPRPRLLMFDEPMGALDRILREQLVADLRTILKRLELTSLYVTHDQNEAFAIADRVLIINQGEIVQSGTPRDLYEHPSSPFVARFLGFRNLIPGKQIGVSPDTIHVETEDGLFTIPNHGNSPRGDVLLLIRAEAALDVTAASPGKSDNMVFGRVVETRFQVGKPQITIETPHATRLVLDWGGRLDVGANVTVVLDPTKMAVYERGRDETE